MKPNHPKLKRWLKVDWSLQDVVLAQKLGCSASTVRYHRHRLQAPKADRHWKGSNTIASQVLHNPFIDWTQNNAVIARSIGCSRAYIAILRKARSLKHHKSLSA